MAKKKAESANAAAAVLEATEIMGAAEADGAAAAALEKSAKEKAALVDELWRAAEVPTAEAIKDSRRAWPSPESPPPFSAVFWPAFPICSPCSPGARRQPGMTLLDRPARACPVF